jgi:hypothetical protein
VLIKTLISVASESLGYFRNFFLPIFFIVSLWYYYPMSEIWVAVDMALGKRGRV